jgi:hypothetical protein
VSPGVGYIAQRVGDDPTVVAVVVVLSVAVAAHPTASVQKLVVAVAVVEPVESTE